MPDDLAASFRHPGAERGVGDEERPQVTRPLAGVAIVALDRCGHVQEGVEVPRLARPHDEALTGRST
jgi:hypothetical protein